MSRTAVRPTGLARTFGVDEVIVTKTDTKGRITYANDVFCRVSAFVERDVVGQPHNIIRHPSMPRGVFRLMWSTLQQRRELFAYVVNLAADGAHYWVLAHITPSYDSTANVVGYHSNRRLPAPEAVRQIEPIYREMLAEEARHSNADEAAAAGLRLLEAKLAQLGTTYDEFVWALTNESNA
ncbi:PAS domain-containing protein [Nocardioides sp.]|uniref:PAS domain-containing protein n=1 Tax=Nocardioides sp. TaxID=35761 RepID=UPI0026293743|nr:PAS domain-containing protein [Nocardioides sp.]